MNLLLRTIPTPLGDLRLVTDAQERVRVIDFADSPPSCLSRLLRLHTGGDPILREAPAEGAAVQALRRYFEGDLRALDRLTVVTHGTPLQERVWAALRGIPPGQVTTYGALARQLGHADPRMAREVGAANAANPVALVVPCHRVIGKDGDLKGYAWGLPRKRWLLAHERAEVPAVRTPLLEGFE